MKIFLALFVTRNKISNMSNILFHSNESSSYQSKLAMPRTLSCGKAKHCEVALQDFSAVTPLCCKCAPIRLLSVHLHDLKSHLHKDLCMNNDRCFIAYNQKDLQTTKTLFIWGLNYEKIHTMKCNAIKLNGLSYSWNHVWVWNSDFSVKESDSKGFILYDIIEEKIWR